jgi:hypothetical protein
LTDQLAYRVNSIAEEMFEESSKDSRDNSRDRVIEQLKEAASRDSGYQEILSRIRRGVEGIKNSFEMGIDERPFFKIREDLTDHDGLILYQGRIVIPKAERRHILELFHAPHQGIERTRRAAATIFWPGISSDIKSTVEACAKCQERRASLPQEPFESDPMPVDAFNEVATDLFEYAGKHYSVYVDRFSRWLEIHHFRSFPTAASVCNVLAGYFARFGIPRKLWSDGGPQYTAAYTKHFLQEWGVIHAVSAPH